MVRVSLAGVLVAFCLEKSYHADCGGVNEAQLVSTHNGFASKGAWLLRDIGTFVTVHFFFVSRPAAGRLSGWHAGDIRDMEVIFFSLQMYIWPVD